MHGHFDLGGQIVQEASSKSSLEEELLTQIHYEHIMIPKVNRSQTKTVEATLHGRISSAHLKAWNITSIAGTTALATLFFIAFSIASYRKRNICNRYK